MKKIVIIIILTFFIIAIIFYKDIANKDIFNIKSLSDFQPFATNKVETEQTIKISTDLPTIDASVAFYPLASSIVENIYNKNSYDNELNYVSTDLAYRNIINKKVDAVIVSKPSDEQKQMIDNSKMNLKFVPFAKEALVFYTNSQNNIKHLTINEIRKVYLGEITNWQEVNGTKADIITYQLERNNGSQTCFETIVKNNNINKNHIEIDDMGEIIRMSAFNKNSIGYAFNSFYSNIFNSSKLKLIGINQIEPTKENIISGEYPLMYNLYFVYNENNDNQNLKVIEDWLLSEQGQKLVKNMGFQSISSVLTN